jgi:hypothetical protein
MRYNDRSPMENHHVAASLTLLTSMDVLPRSLPKVRCASLVPACLPFLHH